MLSQITNPALASQGIDPQEIAQSIKASCLRHGGEATIPANCKKELSRVSKILNISWIERGLSHDAIVICPRGGLCPRDNKCTAGIEPIEPSLSMKDIRQQIIQSM